MEEQKIPRWLLLVGIAGPLVLVGAVVIVVNLNNWLISFDYDLVYVTCEGSGPAPVMRTTCEQYMQQRYAIERGELVIRDDLMVYERIFGTQENSAGEPINSNVFVGWTTRLYVYDTKTDRSREVSPNELAGRQLSGASIAPDGTELRFDREYYSSPFFLFGGSSRGVTLLVQGNGRREIHLPVSANRWTRDQEFRHLGWLERSE